MDLGISGKIAAVAGSTAGLGYASAAALAAEGVHVAICGRHQDRVEAAARRLGAAYPESRVLGLLADVSSADGAAGFVDAARDRLGPIDILVVNSGGPPSGGTADMTPDDYQQALTATTVASIAMCTTALDDMVAQGWGRIVGITSMTVRQPSNRLVLSNVARAGLTAYFKTLSEDVAAKGITVNTVQPGSHETDRLRSLWRGDMGAAAAGVPAGVVGDANDFGKIVAFVCSDAAKFMTGAAIPVDGGATKGLQ